MLEPPFYYVLVRVTDECLTTLSPSIIDAT